MLCMCNSRISVYMKFCSLLRSKIIQFNVFENSKIFSKTLLIACTFCQLRNQSRNRKHRKYFIKL